MATDVTLSLISHTNVGKTTLARTLLRSDVGEVRDQAHVTEVSEAFTLIETGDYALKLWDTPGFGDTARLMRRLRHEGDPVGWLLHQIWDRFVDRPLWCSQEAVHNIQAEADVVLYLVNATEDPEDAGYVTLELELLTWMDRPVLLLLNQVGTEGESLEADWRRFVESRPIVRDVLPLDAFTRCWTAEGVLLDRVADLLRDRKREAMLVLATEWRERNLRIFGSSVRSMAAYLAGAAADREVAPRSATGEPHERGTLGTLKDALKFATVDKKRAMGALNRRLDDATRVLMRDLLALYDLYGESQEKIEQRIQDFQVRGGGAFDERSGAIAGAVVSGALGGLAADALTGGLTLGGGMIAGGILGALGGSALARGYRMIGGVEEPSVTWSHEFLVQLTQQVMLRYLAVAHFGRGRGAYQDLERPAHWSAAVDRAIDARRSALNSAWEHASRGGTDAPERVASELASILDDALREILREAYPQAHELLARPMV
jgi:hypothetical protein